MLKIIGLLIAIAGYLGMMETAFDYPDPHKVVVPAFMTMVGVSIALTDTVECLPDTADVAKETLDR